MARRPRLRWEHRCEHAGRSQFVPGESLLADGSQMLGTFVGPRGRRTIPSLRWWIGAILFASTVINYIDRQTLSLLAPYLKRDYHWTNTDYANIVVAFRVAYSIGQTLCGRLMDRLGTKRGLTLTVLWYSIVSLLTPLARAGISVFVISTFDTDYLLVREGHFDRAAEALGQAGHAVRA